MYYIWTVRLFFLMWGVAAAVVAGCGSGDDEPAVRRAPQTANLWVDGDGGSCAPGARAAYVDAKACASMRDAYEAARAGDVVVVRPGSYPAQAFGGVRDPLTGNNTPPPHDRAVTFVGDSADPSKVKLYQLHFGGDDVTIDGFDVDTRGKSPGDAGGASLETDGGSRNTLVRHSRIGNVDC